VQCSEGQVTLHLLDVLRLLNLLSELHPLEDVVRLPLVLDLLHSLARDSDNHAIIDHCCDNMTIITCMAVIVFCHNSRSYFTGTFLDKMIINDHDVFSPFLFKFKAGVDGELFARRFPEGLRPLGLPRVLLLLEGFVALSSVKIQIKGLHKYRNT
jgi:hypothetical protein